MFEWDYWRSAASIFQHFIHKGSHFWAGAVLSKNTSNTHTSYCRFLSDFPKPHLSDMYRTAGLRPTRCDQLGVCTQKDTDQHIFWPLDLHKTCLEKDTSQRKEQHEPRGSPWCQLLVHHLTTWNQKGCQMTVQFIITPGNKQEVLIKNEVVVCIIWTYLQPRSRHSFHSRVCPEAASHAVCSCLDSSSYRFCSDALLSGSNLQTLEHRK